MKEIVYRGTLTKDKLMELAKQYLIPAADSKYDPNLHSDVYSIIKQADGNYIGETQKFGKLISVREVGPETVLQALLVHPG